MAASRIEVVAEATDKRAFASAVDWPGWTRSGRTVDDAVEALASYAGRYAPVARAAGFPLPATMSFVVVEQLRGDATTTFGAPSQAASIEQARTTKARAERAAALLAAAWSTLDKVYAKSPASLRKGPRGGGRDRDKMYDHVLGADRAYAAKLGYREPQPKRDDRTAITAQRDAILEVVRADRSGAPSREGGWSPRYAARRCAWHALDHAWEMEDRAG